MTQRISAICRCLDRCATFADVGCDHGYCTLYMLENNLCDRAVISDISAKSLGKAERLLARFIDGGRCRSVCCDGLERGEEADEVLIAGMGGEEIVKILKQGYIPQKFVFQPMKNARLLREFLLGNGCWLTADDIFKDGKFYFIIKGERGGNRQNYTPAELEFGRHSLANNLLKEYISDEICKVNTYLQSTMSDINRQNLLKKLDFLQGVYKGEIK